ncbi:MAG: M56 family metallopeptidase [Acidobacteriota bacterium]
MTIRMAVYAVIVSALLGITALFFERAAVWLRLPRRWTWAAGLLSVLALTCGLPWRQPTPPSGLAVAFVSGPFASVTTSVGRWWFQPNLPPTAAADVLGDIVFATWVSASVLLTLFYAAGIIHLRRSRRRWPTAIRGRYSILVSEDIGPAVVGLWSTHIVVPQWALELDAAHVELLLRHEQAHQAARDSALVHFAELAVAAMPLNPVAWWMRARLRVAIEIDCDARVLAGKSGSPQTPSAEVEIYGELLLTVASHPATRPTRFVPALIERPSMLRKRILAMRPSTYRFLRSRLIAASLIGASLVAAAIVLPTPSLNAEQNRDGNPYKPGTPGLMNPVVLKEVRAVYTTEAMRHKIQGTVAMEGVVTTEGRFEEARIVTSLDTVYGLDEQALEAAHLWLFRPGTLKGQPVPVVVTLEMNFRLRD